VAVFSPPKVLYIWKAIEESEELKLINWLSVTAIAMMLQKRYIQLDSLHQSWRSYSSCWGSLRALFL